MRSIRLAVPAGIVAVGVCAVTALATPAVAAPATATAGAQPDTVATAGCHTRLYFNQNTYVRTRPAHDATHLGLAYANDTFDYQGNSSNGFLYGRDVRAGGKTGWVPAANISSMRVCD